MGFLVVLLVPWDVSTRILLVAAVTAIAAGLMFPLSSMIARSRSRAAGLFGMAVVIVEFVLLLLFIWIFDRHTFSYEFDRRIWLTVQIVLMTAVPAAVFLRMFTAKRTRFAGRVGLAVSIAGLLLLLTATYLPDNSYKTSQWLDTAFAVYYLGLISALCLVGHGSDRHYWRWIGVAAGAVACIIALLRIWLHDFAFHNVLVSMTNTNIIRSNATLVTMASISVVVAYTNLVRLIPLRKGHGWLRVGTIATGLGAAAYFDMSAIVHVSAADYYLRGAVAAGILAGCGSLAMLVLARFDRPADAEMLSTELTLTCPRCNRKQAISTGTSDCADCGLQFELHVEEPRCRHCEYLLYGLTSDQCPECGTPIRHGDVSVSAARQA